MKKHFLGKDSKMSPAACPNCGMLLDGALAIDADAEPAPGHWSICIECGHLSVFTEDLKLRNPTEDEIKRVAGNKTVVAAMKALHAIRAPKLTDEQIENIRKEWERPVTSGTGLSLARKRPPTLDPNIIFPGKDPDFTFPEEKE